MPINYPELVVNKSEGFNDSENRLFRLGYDTFLRLWSYPNPFKKGSKGKELCDLLVVFQNHIIIFSDKKIVYTDTEDPKIAWRRWYKRAIENSCRQLLGARKWVTEHPDAITLDAKNDIPFPLDISITKETEFHLIAIASGASQKCIEYFGDGDGGLLIDNDVKGDMHVAADCQPFRIGLFSDKPDEFIHIFDESAYPVIIKELDTITDFVKYLSVRKKLLLSKHIIACGELELLAAHIDGILGQGISFLEQQAIQNFDNCFFDEGSFADLIASAKYRKWKEACKISYFWDELLQKTFIFIETGQSEKTNSPTIEGQNQIFHHFAILTREQRRIVSEIIIDFIVKANPQMQSKRTFPLPGFSDTCLLVFLLPKKSYMKESEYREIRAKMLEDYCLITKLQFPEFHYILGIAHEAGDPDRSSEDFMFLDATEWSSEVQTQAEAIMRTYLELGIILNPKPQFNVLHISSNQKKTLNTDASLKME